MGLDMYLFGEVKAPLGSPLHKIVTDHLGEAEDLVFDEDGYMYVSGWNFGNMVPAPMFMALALEMGITADDGSPHFEVYREGDGFRIAPAIFYWRKANAIHRWFVETAQNGVDECERSEVSGEALMDLLDRCEQIASADQSDQVRLAAELLPTQGGFFFGDTSYDEWYFHKVKETATGLRTQINLMPKPCTFFYQSSW